MNCRLTAGTGKLIITPPFDSELSGFIARRGKNRGVHDHLYARALVLADGEKKLALVFADVIGIDPVILAKTRQKVASLTDLDPESVIISATHTHSGPPTLTEAFLGKPDQAYISYLVNNMAGAVYLAEQSMEPVNIFVGLEECRMVGKNRREQDGPTDPQVLILRLQGNDGPKAILVNYACHPVVLGPSNLLVTADYPFYMIKALEQEYPGAEVMFVNGAAGDINVGHRTEDSIQGKSDARRTFSEAERLGRILAGAALTASENAVLQRGPLNIGYMSQEIYLPLEPLPSADKYQQEADNWNRLADELKENGASFGKYRQAEVWAEWAKKMANMSRANMLKPVIRTELTALTLGDLEFVTFPGEFFHEFALMVKTARAPRPVVILGYSNHNIGYVAPSHVYDEGGYEVEDSFRYYGLPARIARGGGEEVVRNLLAMLN